jgi:acyl carrier protein
MALILDRWRGPEVRATFPSLIQNDSARGGAAPGAQTTSPSDRFERDTLDIIRRLARQPIDPRPQSELLADLGFDSLQVLELVGELEDHFGIAVPLNALTHIRTVEQIVSEVRRLATGTEPAA